MSAAPPQSGRSSPMVHLRTVPTAFQARVVAARLGADGILTELRGPVGGPYPFGDVSIWVYGDDESIARELLLADEVEDLFAALPEDETAGRVAPRVAFFGWSSRQILAAVALVIVVVAVAGRVF